MQQLKNKGDGGFSQTTRMNLSDLDLKVKARGQLF